jgi:hypothetical protein
MNFTIHERELTTDCQRRYSYPAENADELREGMLARHPRTGTHGQCSGRKNPEQREE